MRFVHTEEGALASDIPAPAEYLHKSGWWLQCYNLYMEKNTEYSMIENLTDEQVSIVREALMRHDFMILGKSGVGKSYVLSVILKLFRLLHYRIIATAPTGRASQALGGVTLRRVLCIPVDELGFTSTGKVCVHRKILRDFDCIVVDEVSMVRIDFMSCLLTSVDKINKEREDNGEQRLQVILCGDLRQLPPVCPEPEQNLFGKLYRQSAKLTYFFSAPEFKEHHFPVYELKHVIRQGDDPEFADALNKLWLGADNEEAVNAAQWINDNSATSPFTSEEDVTLSGYVSRVNDFNQQRLDELPGEAFQVGYGDDQIQLKIGAKVMVTRNDPEFGPNMKYVNGSMGRVRGIEGDRVEVMLDNGTPLTFEATADSGVPLILADALTVHKAQGATLHRINVEVDSCSKFPGQLYTALSRVKSVRDIHLSAPILKKHLVKTITPDVEAFLRGGDLESRPKRKVGRPSKGCSGTQPIKIPKHGYIKQNQSVGVLLEEIRERSAKDPDIIDLTYSALTSLLGNAEWFSESIKDYIEGIDDSPVLSGRESVPGGTEIQNIVADLIPLITESIQRIKKDSEFILQLEATLHFVIDKAITAETLLVENKALFHLGIVQSNTE